MTRRTIAVLARCAGAHLARGASIEPPGSVQMRWGRGGAAAVTLNDGRVVIFGGNQYTGCNPEGCDAEIWNPASKTFTTVTASMNDGPRSRLTATLLDNGTVLIVGGDSYPSYYTSEIFNPGDNSFTRTTGNPVAPRGGHTATKLSDGKVLIVGGDYSGSAEIYDPNAQSFTATSDSPLAGHTDHTATVLCDGKVLIAGGFSRTADLYDPVTASFRTSFLPPMVRARHGHTANLLSSCKVLLLGGDARYPATSELYDPSAGGFFVSGPSDNTYRNYHVAVTLDDGKIVIAGSSFDTSSGSSRVLELYDPIANTFSVLPISESYGFYPRVFAASYPDVANCNGCPSGHKVLIAGGGPSSNGYPLGFIFVPTAMSPPPPVVTAVSPATARTCGNTTVTVDGLNFQSGATLGYSFNAPTSVTATRIVATTKAASPGTFSLTVTNPDSQFGYKDNSFTFVQYPPGDVNGDGILSPLDIFYMTLYVNHNGPAPLN